MTDIADPFAVLGLPRRFAIDPNTLAARHLELSRALHPDRYAGASSAERRLALGRAIEVNEAHRTLKDPVRRAEAYLHLEGLHGEVGEVRESASDPALLMEVLELQEELDHAKTCGDEAQIAQLAAHAQRTVTEAETVLAQTLESASELTGNARIAQLRKAIPLLGRLRYAVRFRNEARSAQDHLALNAPL